MTGLSVVDLVRRDRDQWRRKFYTARDSRDYWRDRAHTLRLQLEQVTQPERTRFSTSKFAYVSEDDRLEARRRTWRQSKRRARALSAAKGMES